MSLLDALLAWWRNRRAPKAPSIEIHTMAQSMTVTWTLPTRRSDNSTLAVSDVASSEVSISADVGVTYSVLANVLPGATQSFQRDLADGNYKIRIITVDTQGRRGVPAIGDAVIRTIAPPAAPTINSIVIV